MLIHRKITIVLVVIVAIFAMASYFGLSKTLVPTFDELELHSAMQDIVRAKNGLSSSISTLIRVSEDWGYWDSIHDYMNGKEPNFIEDNLGADSLSLLGQDLNFMAIYNLGNERVWSVFVDSGTDDIIPMNESVIDSTSLDTLLDHQRTSSEIHGLIISGHGPLLVSSQAILRSDDSGPKAGTLIVGRLLDEPFISNLRESAEVQVTLSTLTQQSSDAVRLNTIGIFGQHHEELTETDRVMGQTLHDIHGKAVATLIVRSPRNITGLRQDTTNSVIVMFAILCTVLLVGLWLALRHVIVTPISRLRNQMIRIQRDGDLTARVGTPRSDEIGDLAGSFDDMLQKLDRAKQQYIEQSYNAGMAEVAAGVLHNVRNSLMPVVSDIAEAGESAAASSSANIGRALDEVLDIQVPAERRTKFARYLRVACQDNDDKCEEIQQHIDRAQQQLDQVLEILNEQEAVSHAKPVIERIGLRSVIEEAQRVIPLSTELVVDITLSDTISHIHVDAHRLGLVQVLSNLLLNAYESISRKGMAAGRISIDAELSTDLSEPEVRVSICDSGVGITASDLKQVFERGYTTKRGSGGLGLHWSANTLATMRGRISATSDGSGVGAQFTITLMVA